MNIYHLQVEDDQAGRAVVASNKGQVEAMGGEVMLAPSFGIGPAFVIFVLPEGVYAPEGARQVGSLASIPAPVEPAAPVTVPVLTQEVEHGESAESTGDEPGADAGQGGESLGIDRY